MIPARLWHKEHSYHSSVHGQSLPITGTAWTFLVSSCTMIMSLQVDSCMSPYHVQRDLKACRLLTLQMPDCWFLLLTGKRCKAKISYEVIDDPNNIENIYFENVLAEDNQFTRSTQQICSTKYPLFSLIVHWLANFKIGIDWLANFKFRIEFCWQWAHRGTLAGNF